MDGSGLDGRKALAKLLKTAENVEFELLNLPDQKARDFVRQQVTSLTAQAKAAGFKLTPDAAEYLTAATGSETTNQLPNSISASLRSFFSRGEAEQKLRAEGCYLL